MSQIYLKIFVIAAFMLMNSKSFSITNKIIKTEVDSVNGYFSGRISRVNFHASLLRIKVSFNNIKYLNKKDKVEFWQEKNPKLRCKGFIIGKSPEYILLKIPNIASCGNYLDLSNGFYMKFHSIDLANNILMGKSLIKVLLKKRLALKGILGGRQRDLDRHVEKVHVVNNRYQLIREKLEAEWRKELDALEEDRIFTLSEFKRTEVDLDEINHKLEKYKVADDNLELDRWSLDPRFYFKK